MGVVKRLTDRESDGPIKAGSMNLTLITGGVISLGTIATRFTDVFEFLLGFKPSEHPGAAAAVLAALVLTIGLIFFGDLVARGLASSRVSTVSPAPAGWTATLISSGKDKTGYEVAALRVTGSGTEFFVTKDGEDPSWRLAGTENGQITINAT